MQYSIKLRLFIYLFIIFSYVHQAEFDGPTAVSRLDVLHSIVVYKTFNIDAYHSNTPDKAYYADHYYSDKAPGTILISLPAFFLSCSILEVCNLPLESRQGWLISSWVTCSGSLAIAACAGAVACFLWLQKYVSERTAMLTVLGIFIGGMPWPYCTMLYSHALVIGFLCVAIYCIDADLSTYSLCAQRRCDIIGGICAGMALASEYTAGLIVVGLMLWLANKSRGRCLQFMLGTTAPLLTVPTYSYICLGNPFVLPYSFQATFPEMQHGLYAIGSPDFETALQLLFLPTRGLFFWSPFLIFWLFAWRLPELREWQLRFVCVILPSIHILVMSGRVWDWQAGPAMGARYLAPILPLLALPCALMASRNYGLGVFLTLSSACLTFFATVTSATPNGGISNPLLEYNMFLFKNDHFAFTLGAAVGLSKHFSIIVLFCFMLIYGRHLIINTSSIAPEN